MPTPPTASPIDYQTLVSGGRVHGSLYRDPLIFERELREIWNKLWVYVGHESELAKPGDFLRREIGTQPVLMIRGDDGVVRVFYNRCRHRGNLLCNRESGNTDTFRCPYHAWTYAKDGALLEPTFAEGYNDNLRREEFGLTPVPRQDSYRGLIFASLSAEGISLRQHLGQVTEFVDLFMDLSPTGHIELSAGCQKLRYRGNWKFLPENSLEGDYHGPFIHRIAFELHSRRTGLNMSSLYENQVPDVIRSLPGGHMVEDYRGATMSPPRRPPTPARQAYIAAMEARYGAEKARQLLGTVPPLVFVFPNLIYIMTHIRRVQPVSVDETFVYYHPVMLQGVDPEINEAKLREHEFGFGPASFISPDDIEVMERNQIGVQAQGNDWQYIARGLHRVKEMPGGGTAGYTMDENHLRGMWQHYASLMSGPDT
jgi:phenylpropionate dioxygenase-like ring-hydroxylating dioxygenase large terminal subunit